MRTFVFVLVMAVAVLLFGHWRNARRRAELQALAAAFGLTFERAVLGVLDDGGRAGGAGPPSAPPLLRVLPGMETSSVSGTYNGVAVRLHRRSRGARMVVSGRHPMPLSVGLYVASRTAFDNIASRVGVQDLRTGNERFDREVVIQGNAPAEITALFSQPEVQQAVLDVFQTRMSTIDDDGADPAAIRPMLDAVTRAVLAIDNARAFSGRLRHRQA
jgi:hypothetical protein